MKNGSQKSQGSTERSVVKIPKSPHLVPVDFVAWYFFPLFLQFYSQISCYKYKYSLSFSSPLSFIHTSIISRLSLSRPTLLSLFILLYLSLSLTLLIFSRGFFYSRREWRCCQIRGRKSWFRCVPSSASSSRSCSGTLSPKWSSRRSEAARRRPLATARMATLSTWLRRTAWPTMTSSLSAPRSRTLSPRVRIVTDLISHAILYAFCVCMFVCFLFHFLLVYLNSVFLKFQIWSRMSFRGENRFAISWANLRHFRYLRWSRVERLHFFFMSN